MRSYVAGVGANDSASNRKPSQSSLSGVLYGSGYVLLAFIRADLVERWHWLTETQLLDAIAVGQVTPGPVFTTATFIGYVLGGTPGAIVATLGIFLPAFFFVRCHWSTGSSYSEIGSRSFVFGWC